MRRVFAAIFLLILVFSLASISLGFDNNKENFDPLTKDPIPYTIENINSRKLKGGHDTLTVEGILLKEQVHQGTDPDGGADFRKKMVEDALPYLRMGAHDEDTSKLFNLYLNDPPIGPNKDQWGDFFQHFYNPDTQKGLKGIFNSAPNRAMDYFVEVLRKIGCGTNAINKISENDKKKIYDYFGRILHLIQDMGNPAHTRDDLHVFTKTFEDHVKTHWSEIVNSDVFKRGVTPEEYLNGNYGNLPDIYYPVFFPEKFMKSLADISKNYYTDGLGTMTDEQIQANVNNLIPETIKYTGGYINAIYQMMSGEIPGLRGLNCDRPPDPPSPANDHPDDRFDVSDEFYWEKEFGLTVADLMDLYLRTAMKKGKIGVWYGKRFREIFIEGRTIYKDASQEIKDAIEAEFSSIKKKLEQRGGQAESDWKGAPDVALFTNGFYKPSISLMLKIGEPVSFQKVDFNPEIFKDHPVMLVPTGGFYGLKNSSMVKTLLAEYVKNGGTLVVFTQQHGYDWELLPTAIDPETGELKTVSGYGYQEDQSCQFNSVYIDTYHPVLSVFSTSTANIGVDGYFTSYPDNSTILLRRVSNGQPAMIMYPYGNGHVIATTMYTDFAFTHNQTNKTEIDFIQSIISWAKKPSELPEIKPGETIDLSIDLKNFVDEDTASVRFTILDPSRKTVNEQTVHISIPAGQSVTIPFTYSTITTSPLGVYHIDYKLFNAQGEVIQPQAETDSGRFVVSKPPNNPYKSPDFGFSVQSDREQYIIGTSATFTFIIWNFTDADRQVKLTWDLSHRIVGLDEPVMVPAKGNTTFIYVLEKAFRTRLNAWIKNEAGNVLGYASKGIYVTQPSVNINVTTDKTIYAKGETVIINATLKNNIAFDWQPTVMVSVKDSQNTQVFEDVKKAELATNGSLYIINNFTLPSMARMGSYTVKVEAWYGDRFLSSLYTRFELPQSQISITPNLPSTFNVGTNSIPFTISNTGRINVSSGTIDLILKAPDGSTVYSGSQPFSIVVGESKTLDIPISIPSINLGNYVLTYSQSDETRAGKPTAIVIPNSIEITNLSFDKPLYKVRETVNGNATIKNIGKFNLENISLTLSAQDLNYTESQTISLGAGLNTSFNFTIPILETISPGQHNVSLTISLPGAGSINKNGAISIPPSSFYIMYQGANSISSGETIAIMIGNSGGVDTQYEAYIYFFDQAYEFFDSKSEIGSILSDGQTSLSYTLPDQLIEGIYQFRVEIRDIKTNKTTYYYSPFLNITGLKGNLLVQTNKDIYFSNEETITLSTIVNQGRSIVDGNLHLEIVCAESASSSSPEPVSFHIFTEENYVWVEHGVLHFPPYFDHQELSLPLSPDPWGYAYVRIRHEGTQMALIDYVTLKDSRGNSYSPFFVGVPEWRDYTQEAQVEDGVPAEVTGVDFYAYWDNLPSGVSYALIITALEGNPCGIVWQADTPINQGSGVTGTINLSPGIIGQSGKFYLKGDLRNIFGQSIKKSYHPFYIIDGDTVLIFNTEKRVYKSGEAVTITGQIENHAPIQAENLMFTLNSSQGGQNPQLLLNETINLPSRGTYPFTITTIAAEEGVVNLVGVVKQNNQVLVSITDQYEVTNPLIYTSIDIPEIVGNESFTIGVEIYNDSKVDATVQFEIQSSGYEDSQTITLPAGGIKIVQYQQQIHQTTPYTFTFSGDLNETIMRTVTYGLGASIQFGAGSPEIGIFPEGSLLIPVTIMNTGQSEEALEISYQLNPGSVQQTKIYSLPIGGSITDHLHFDLTEGEYQITATSQRPDAIAQANFFIRKENQAEMTIAMGNPIEGLIPVNVNLTNLGYNEISGSLSLSVIEGSGQTVWNGEEIISQFSPQSSQLITLNINPSSLEPNPYTLQAQLLTNSNQVILTRSLEFGIQSANFQISQTPPYQIFNSGQEATFTFGVKNIGNQEGSFDLRFKAYDLIDSTQREWLRAGEEKAVTFRFMLPEDWEEKDYFAEYELKDSRIQGVEGLRGLIKYHLVGINLNVNASLNKPYYSEGEIARLTIDIQSDNPNPQNLFARVSYTGYELQQTFTLIGSQVLIFDIPLTHITGEKLFYGIYHESGRAIHLNSLYIHQAGEVLTITTDKQVYSPGDIVIMTVSGNTRGEMTLSGPGGYEETFSFTGLATKSFSLPSTITAGTYFINVELTTQNFEPITAVYPFDVAGVQVKAVECQNDRGKYGPSDTIKTTFILSSNTTMPAILKTWTVDPMGNYTLVGEVNINLSSSENTLVTYHSPLNTMVSGIHKLVYGIYGPENLLLCSGSEAFDVGDAVLTGLSTDREDYRSNGDLVTVMVSFFGSVNTELQLELDGVVIKTEMISLSGFTVYTTTLQNIIPGPHTLKATLTAGGLTSTKETTFTYALMDMPKPQISISPAYLDYGDVHVGSTSTQTITLSSIGNIDLAIGVITLSGANSGEFSIQNDTCSGNSIDPSGNCTLDLFFSPTSPGIKTASLFVPSNAKGTAYLYLPLNGVGVTSLSVSINPDGGGRVIGTGINCPGDCVEVFSIAGATPQLTAAPNEGYQFANWTGDINASENPVTLNLEYHKNVNANFVIKSYLIMANANLGGIIIPSGSIAVPHGASQTFSMIPNAGYRLADVKIDGLSIGAVATYTFNQITSSHIIEAIFDRNIPPTWAKTYGGKGHDLAFTIKETEDGGSILAGESWSFNPLFSDAWVIKLDAHGGIQWQRKYGGNLNDTFYSVERTQDGGYIMGGETDAIIPFLGLFWMVKIDKEGQIQWQKTYGRGWAHSVQQTLEGGYVAVGMNMGRPWVVKLDREGGIQWQKKYTGILGDFAQSIRQTSDGGYIVAGMIKGNVWVLKLNSVGKTQWQKSYGNSYVDANFSIQQTQDGGYILASVSLTFGTGYTDLWIVKLDPSGEIEWQKNFGGAGIEMAHAVEQTLEGGYVVVGWTESFGAGGTDAWVLKLDPNGEIKWQKTFGGSGFDLAHAIEQTQDGGYLVTGWTESFGAGDMDVWVLKLDAHGDISGCPEGIIGITFVTPYQTNALAGPSNETGQGTYISPKNGNATMNETTINPGSICGD